MSFFTIYSENRFVIVLFFTAGCAIVMKNNCKVCGILFAIVTVAMVT